MEKKTKIVATLGPATDTEPVIEHLIEAGVNVFRLNFSHGMLSEHQKKLTLIRDISSRMNRVVAVLGDLPGPKLRIGEIAGGEVRLEEGSILLIEKGSGEGTADRLFLEEDRVFSSVSQDQMLFVNDGLVSLRVKDVRPERIVCQVEKGGFISSRKGLNIPYLPDQFPSLTEQDRAIIDTIRDWELDYLALSFVRSPNDLETLRSLVGKQAASPSLIAKIEKPQALPLLRPIVEHSDGVMVARGDLGVEIPIEEVPYWQKKMIQECRRQGKPVIVATQMLESMTHHPLPTRAEVSDVAGAIYDGTDAVMLSGETAIGEFPRETILTAHRIAQFTEKQTVFTGENQDWMDDNSEVSCAVAYGAVEIAAQLDVPVIVTCTYSGSTARRVSRFRPCQPILALSPVQRTLNTLALCYGVIPRLIPVFENQEQLIEEAKRMCLETGLAHKDDHVAITAGVPLNRSGHTNFLQVEKI